MNGRRLLHRLCPKFANLIMQAETDELVNY
jgi:hypothetical protein